MAQRTLRLAPSAFSLVELLVVLSVISLLCGLLMPVLGTARAKARSMLCKAGLRQLVLANTAYAVENNGFYVPAAEDLWDRAGLHRWHGTRDRLGEPFDPSRGPLKAYWADGKVRQCPGRPRFLQGQTWDENFEQGCGGYGYNMAYIGSRLWAKACPAPSDLRAAYSQTTQMTQVSRPSQTLMFADAAMCSQGTAMIEYSFAEPPYAVVAGQVVEGLLMSPSIHFRHSSLANIGWTDGHVDQHLAARLEGENAYGVRSAAVDLGWFGPVDNSLFDLQ